MRKYQHQQQGAALIELALSIPFMIMLSMIVIEFGRALYEYNTVTKSVRDAVRYLSVQMPNTLCANAQNLVVYGTTTTGTQPLAPGLKTSAVSCSWQTTGALPLINTVTVTVTGTTSRHRCPACSACSCSPTAVSTSAISPPR